jgi:hypothetical protein
LEIQTVCRALPRTLAKTGKSSAARREIMAITTSSSTSVNPFCETLWPWREVDIGMLLSCLPNGVNVTVIR